MRLFGVYIMKKLLITGFDPFGGESINPAWEAVKRLPDRIGDVELTKKEIPTVFGKAGDAVLTEAARILPDAILCIGQAGGRDAVTPELVAINLREARIADNEGNQPSATPIVEGGDKAYFSTLPVREMVTSIKEKGINARLSYSAGAFVCNDVLYTLLHKYDGGDIRVGFIHVPFLPEQAKDGIPSMPLEIIIEAIKTAIEVI